MGWPVIMRNELAEPAAEIIQEPYAVTADVVLAGFDATVEGLTQTQAEERLEAYGPNALPHKPPKPAILRYLAHYNDVLIFILLAAAALKAVIGDWVEFGVIAVACVAIATVGFVQEGRANQALAGIKSMLAHEAQALRAGQWRVVPVEDLVPGDIVRLRSGDRVPADLRLISETNLQVDEAVLTGESMPSEKDPAPVSPNAAIGDRTSMAYSGTIVTAGTGVAVVVATGGTTEIGRITTMVSEVEQMETPLAQQMNRLSKQIAMIVGVLAAVMLAVGWFVHRLEVPELISAAISFAVAAVPEGLPALVTITLALGVQQMAKRHAIVRKMASIETLGSVDIVCSDKTGTLTQNEMTVTTVKAGGLTYRVSGTGYAPVGSIEPSDYSPVLTEMLTAAALVNEAKLEETPTGWRVVGPPTEGAMTTLIAKSGLEFEPRERLAQVPFESAHKFSAILDENGEGDRRLHVVGAPDRLLARSTQQMGDNGENRPLEVAIWESRMSELAQGGLRLLGVAARPASELEEITVDDVENLTFLGLVGIVDPPRPEVQVAIEEALGAGVSVKMITGDHVETATAIARELGIGSPKEALRALTGHQLEEMSDPELAQVAHDVDVYARTSPEHKIRIVAALQSHGDVVAMTGDGVNDAPSVAKADVGVAMGIKGTEATKEAADVVLQDDNFATITAAIEEGRRIYDNIRKSVVFLLPTNGAQSLVVLVAILAGWALPLSPVQILWINLVTAVTLSIPLAVEPAEPGIMRRPPREPDEQILSGRTFTLVVLVSFLIGSITLAALVSTENLTDDRILAQTIALNTLAFSQLAYLFNCRILSGSSITLRALQGNRTVWIAAGALLALQLLLVYTPFLNQMFGTVPMRLSDWGIVVVLSIVVFFVVELMKMIVRKFSQQRV